jgi:putative ABC transport system permease protein
MAGRPGTPSRMAAAASRPPARRRRWRARPFLLTYLRRELQQRMRQAVIVALGLAVGVGLVITVTAASSAVSNAQRAVLRSLYGIGTDITLTRALPASSSHGARGAGQASGRTDLLSTGDQGIMGSASVTSIARLPGVMQAAGGLTLTDLRQQAGGLPSTVSVDGVDPAHASLGPYASGKIRPGRRLTASDADSDVAVVNSSYAAANRIAMGSAITIAGSTFTVAGLIRQPLAGGSADIYIPLRRAQALTGYPGRRSLAGQVNIIYVAAASASAVPSVKAEIARQLPDVTVTTAGDLAGMVTGALASAARLVNDLGRWLAVAVLLLAVAVASLLSAGAVARRVREFGTLRALGWRGRQIVAQIMGESLVTGVTGAALGVAFGFAGTAIVNAAAPKLSATVAQSQGSHTTVAVDLAANVSDTVVAAAVVLAVAGGLVAGCIGAWRATRLRPADAFTQAE